MSIVLNKDPGGIRCGYLVVDQPKKNNLNGEMEYSLQMIVPKGSVSAKIIQAEIQRVIGEKWGNNPPPHLKLTFRDADAEAEAKGKKVDEHMKNSHFMNVSTKERPGIVGPDGLPAANAAEYRSGDYFHISIGCFPFVLPEPGVSFGLNNVQFVRKGETLTGRKRAEDEFDSLPELTPAEQASDPLLS